jgi:hypothetical protein
MYLQFATKNDFCGTLVNPQFMGQSSLGGVIEFADGQDSCADFFSRAAFNYCGPPTVQRPLIVQKRDWLFGAHGEFSSETTAIIDCLIPR